MDQKHLLEKISTLEALLAAKEQDLDFFREQFQLANRRLERLIGQISRDLKVLSKLQHALVPTEFPHIQGVEFSTKFIPSMVAGGDYLDIFEHKDKFKFSVLMSSASSYSVSAALLSTLLTLSVQMEAKRAKAPHTVAKMIQEDTQELFQSADTVDLFYGIMDRKTFSLNYVLLGEIYVFHYDFKESELTAIEADASKMSQNSDLTQLNSSTLKMRPKDELIVCSKGLVEVCNIDGEPMGLDRLIQALLSAPKTSVHDFRNEVLFQVENFAKGVNIPRDQTIALLQVKEKVLQLAT